MTDQTKCRIANTIDKTGRALGPVAVTALVLSSVSMIIRVALQTYKRDPSEFFRGMIALAGCYLLFAIILGIGASIDNFVNRHKNKDCK